MKLLEAKRNDLRRRMNIRRGKSTKTFLKNLYVDYRDEDRKVAREFEVRIDAELAYTWRHTSRCFGLQKTPSISFMDRTSRLRQVLRTLHSDFTQGPRTECARFRNHLILLAKTARVGLTQAVSRARTPEV